MDYPYKYIVVASCETQYSDRSFVSKFCDLKDAIECFERCERAGDNVALYQLSRQANFNK